MPMGIAAKTSPVVDSFSLLSRVFSIRSVLHRAQYEGILRAV